mgnify:FL=1
MINKQGLCFLTLTSLILVLSVYYITMPNELLITTNGYQETTNKGSDSPDDSSVSVSIKESNVIETMKTLLSEERQVKTNKLNATITNDKLSKEERDNAISELKYIAKIENMELKLTKKIKDEFKLNSFIKIEDDVVEVVINSSKHDASLVVKIMNAVQKEFDDTMYISVSFKE